MKLSTAKSASVLPFLGAVLTLACGFACGGSNSGKTDGGSGEPLPAECVLGEPPANYQYPAGPYGIEVGDTFEDFEFENCDGEPVAFSEILAQSELVLFNIGAGWCEPCIEESETLDSEIFRESCQRGLQVVQVLFQDEQSRPATKLFCKQWEERFGLSFPVLVDPTFLTSKYFESVSAQTPQNYLVSKDGKIVFKETGTPAADLPQRIDEFLSRP